MWRRLRRRRDRDAEIEAEIDLHLRMAIADRIAAGESPEEAKRAAHLDFGNVRLVKEEARAVWSWTTLEQLLKDLREGARVLRRAPGLSISAIALIALVIGGNTTIYSVVHGMLTNPAPGVEPGGLVSVGWIAPHESVRPHTSYPMFRALAEQARAAELVAFRDELVTFRHTGATVSFRGAAVSANYFDVLRVRPVRGRGFVPADGHETADGLVVVISRRIWQQQFLGAENVVGQSVRLDGQPATIVGVAPDGFQGVWLGEATDLWMPIVPYARLHDQGASLDDRSAEGIAIIGRLTEGRSIEEAQEEMTAIADRTGASSPAAITRKAAMLFPYTATAAHDSLFAERGPRFLAIFSLVTALTLLIACANVANLMLARAASRQREMAVRQSFGASRWRIVRLVIAEGATLSLAAWVVACLVASWLSEALPSAIPPSTNGGAPLAVNLSPDWGVLGYAMLLAIAGTILFTIAPAVHTWRQDLLSFLKAGEQGVVQGRSHLSHALVVAQLASSVLLLTCAGLGYRSLGILDGAPLGFDPRNVLLVTVDTSTVAKTPEANRALLDRMVARLRTAPGLEHVTYATMSPSHSWARMSVRTSASSEPSQTEVNVIEPGYFDAFAVRPLAGRTFTQGDRDGAPEVAIVNAHMADSLWPGEGALGRTLMIGSPERQVTIVGVVPNVLYGGVRRDERPRALFLPAAQSEISPSLHVTLQIRHSGLDAAVAVIGRALQEVDPAVPMVYVRSMQADLDEITWGVRTLTVLLVIFAGGSLLIASLGQYAAMAFSMRRRVRDFGIRMALGASAHRIVRSTLGEGFRLTAIGLLVGFALAVITARAAAALLHGVTPTDPSTYVAVFAVLGASSLAACYVPARRAARVDPMVALRAE